MRDAISSRNIPVLQSEKDFQNAAHLNDLGTMTILFEKNVDINARNHLDRTALHYAVAGNHEDAIKFLVDHKARVNVPDKRKSNSTSEVTKCHGITALHLASWHGSLPILEMLVKAGARQKEKNQDGMNILHFAACNNHSHIVEYIIADLQIKDLCQCDENGKKPFHLAAENGHVQMLETLMNLNFFTQEKDKEGNTALHLAAKNGHIEVIEFLIMNWEEVNDTNEAGETAFFLAVSGAHEECAELLLRAGSDVNNLTKNNMSALHEAAQNCYLSLVNFLIKKNVDLEAQNEQKCSAIHLAVKKKNIPVIHILMKEKCNINAVDNRNQTPLHMAAELGDIEVVEMLLKAGADLTIKDKKGKTPLDVAARSNYILIVDMIIKAERYFTWKQANAESVHPNENYPLTFKLDHTIKTMQIRTVIWNLANNQLKPNEWKSLALKWEFTEQQIKAIGEQWIGTKSYKEHGHRLLLIWLHGILLAQQNPVKHLYEGLIHLGRATLAGE
uniref:Ankyrin repeat and death domain containing 1B n=1 Tax=Latimeria chalumnae TaxID=7897 RepID=H3A3D6_LATCH